MNKEEIENFIEKKVEEKEEKKTKLYLSNEEIEKEEWEIIHIDVRPTGKQKGELHYGLLDIRFAYKDDIRDTFMYRRSGSIDLGKVYPGFIKRKIISRIKEVLEDKVPKQTRVTNNIINKPSIITIKRQK